MYRLPNDFDFSVFVGKTLEMVCVTANTICLHFGADVSITIEAEYSVSGAAEQRPRKAVVPEFDPVVLSLIEHSVTVASGTPEGTLILEFDMGAILRCYDPTELYEAYSIRMGDRTVIV